MVDFVVARILDQIGLKHSIGKRWTGEEIDEF
jgi:3-polyprenyl-4-hydroxybenzoate decarboxylase